MFTLQAGADTVGLKPQANVGRLMMRENKTDGTRKCELSLERKDSRTTKKMGDTDCENDEVYFYRFENAPSGALITFYDQPGCDGTWWYTVRITKYEVTSKDWLSLKELKNKQKGDWIDTGVYLDDKKDGGQVEGKLSCVAIDY
ncbi:hypothetical protein [Pseudomonas sp. microsymbiont 2]